MKSCLRLSLIIAFTLVLSGHARAQAALQALEFPPKEWSLSISINLSKDLLYSFFKEQPDKDRYVYVEAISFWLDDNGGLRGPRKHPVLTGKVPSNNLAEHEVIVGGGSIAHVPLKDQEAIYKYAFEAVRAFQFVDEARRDYDASGIDFDLRLEINGRSFSVAYRKIRVQDGLPKGITDLMATLRRSLPVEYDPFFNLLRVPKLAALPVDEAEKIAKCLVHNEWMKVAEVPIWYGFPASREEYWKATKVAFPNACNAIHAGCVVTPGSPRSGQVIYCASCRAAEKAWVKENEPARAPK